MPPEPGAPPPRVREAVPLPSGIRVAEKPGGGWTIERRWFGPSAIVALVFAVFWIWGARHVALWLGTWRGPFPYSVFRLFPLVHLAIGVGVGYGALAYLLNTTRVEADRAHVSVRHGPLPWKRGVDLSPGAIAQIYCVPRLRRSGDETPSTVYDIRARLRDGRTENLLTGLLSCEQALYVEQEMEWRLGIEDRPVLGEVRL